MITINHVNKSYNGYQILRDVNMTLQAGQIVGFEGENGSGKTLLLKIICGLVQPDSGEVIWKDKKIGKDIDFPEETGIMIEEAGFFNGFTARENLRLLASYRGRMTNLDVDAAIKMVGLDERSKKPVGKYSMGMRQRLSFAQAMMENPLLLILDEPFNSLDLIWSDWVKKKIKDYLSSERLIIITSHHQNDLDMLCSAIYHFRDGQVELE